MIQRKLSKRYLFLLILVWFWLAVGMSFRGEASAVPDASEQPGRVSFESQEPYSQEVVRLENGDHTRLSIQHRRILQRKGARLLAALILWCFWRNYLYSKFWRDIVLKKAIKEVIGAFERRGPPSMLKFFAYSSLLQRTSINFT